MLPDFSHTLAAPHAPTLASYASLACAEVAHLTKPTSERTLDRCIQWGSQVFCLLLRSHSSRANASKLWRTWLPQFFSSTHRPPPASTRQGDLRGRCRKVSVARESPSWSCSLALEEKHGSPGALSLSTGIILSPCCCQLSAFAKVLTSQCRSRSDQLEFGLAIAFRVSVGTCRSFLCLCLFLGNSHGVTCIWQDQLCWHAASTSA